MKNVIRSVVAFQKKVPIAKMLNLSFCIMGILLLIIVSISGISNISIYSSVSTTSEATERLIYAADTQSVFNKVHVDIHNMMRLPAGQNIPDIIRYCQRMNKNLRR